MSDPIDLITAADVLQAVPRLAGNPDLADLITDVSAEVLVFCGQNFGLAGYTETHDGTMRSRLWLRNTPILNVSAVTIEDVPVDNSYADAWTVTPATGELLRGTGQSNDRFAPWFPDGSRNVVVQYTAGALEAPRPVRRACILTVKHWLDLTRFTGLYRSEEIGKYRYELRDGGQCLLPDAARQLLVPFMLDLIA